MLFAVGDDDADDEDIAPPLRKSGAASIMVCTQTQRIDEV